MPFNLRFHPLLITITVLFQWWCHVHVLHNLVIKVKVMEYLRTKCESKMDRGTEPPTWSNPRTDSEGADGTVRRRRYPHSYNLSVLYCVWVCPWLQQCSPKYTPITPYCLQRPLSLWAFQYQPMGCGKDTEKFPLPYNRTHIKSWLGLQPNFRFGSWTYPGDNATCRHYCRNLGGVWQNEG